MQKKVSTTAVALALMAAVALSPPVSVAISETSEVLDQALRLKPRLDNGAEIFDTCAACHGTNGWGASDGSVPAIAGQSVPVLVQQIVEFRYNGRYSIRMQHFADRHHLTTPQDLADVAAYVESLPPRQPPPSARIPARERVRACLPTSARAVTAGMRRAIRHSASRGSRRSVRSICGNSCTTRPKDAGRA